MLTCLDRERLATDDRTTRRCGHCRRPRAGARLGRQAQQAPLQAPPTTTRPAAAARPRTAPPSRRRRTRRRRATMLAGRADRARQATYCATCHSDRGKARRPVARRTSMREQAQEQRRAHRKDDPQAARRHDAAGRREASRAGRPSTRSRRVRVAHGRARRAQSESRLASVPAAESRRVHARGPGSAGRRRRRRDAFLPPDTISHGFDNVADAQSFSPTLMDGYLRAASQISRLAVGDRTATAASSTYKIGAHGVADAPRRRRADGHARRHRRSCTPSRPTATTC